MKVEIKGDKMIITVDYDKAGTPSSSTKTLLHASDNTTFEGMKVQVNAYSKNKK